MKKITLLFMVGFSVLSFGQGIVFNSMTATPTETGLNINLKVTTFNGAGYLNHSYTINGSNINLTVCYWFDNTLPIYQLQNNFPIILPSNQQDYTINLTTFNSSSQTTCDNFSQGPSATTTFLDTSTFQNNTAAVAPNPFSSSFEINSKQPISNYKIFDALGKQIINVNSKLDLDLKTEALKKGVYFLELTFDNGKTNNIKLIKN